MPRENAVEAEDSEEMAFDAEVGGEAEVELSQESEQEPAEEPQEQEALAEAPVTDARLAEGGEEEETAEQEAEAQVKQDRGHKKNARERKDQYRRAAKRYKEERDFALQQNWEILQRLNAVEGTTFETRLLAVDSRLTECQSDAETALNLETQALQQGDAQGVRDARQIREQALSRANVLKQEKDRLAQVINQRASQPPRQQPLPGAAEIQQLSSQFTADKPWIQWGQNGQPANLETRVAHNIDLALSAEGWASPRDPEYWQELDKRVRAALPRLFQSQSEGGDDEDGDSVEQTQTTIQPRTVAKPVAKPVTQARKGPAVGSSGSQSNAQAGRKKLSADRVQALKDLGVWDARDPATRKERDEYIREFDKWDRDHGVNS